MYRNLLILLNTGNASFSTLAYLDPRIYMLSVPNLTMDVAEFGPIISTTLEPRLELTNPGLENYVA